MTPTKGTLPAGKSTTFTISTYANTLPNGIDTALVQVSAPGLSSQNILVKLTVQSGLSQVGVNVSGKSLSYSQGNLQPSSETITIPALRSNHSMIWDSQDDLLFVFGGIDGQGNLLNDLWTYNPETQTWKELNATTGT